LTQKYVEEVSGVNCDTLRKIESSLVIPRYETLEYLSMAYKVDLLINIDEKTIYKWRDFIFY